MNPFRNFVKKLEDNWEKIKISLFISMKLTFNKNLYGHFCKVTFTAANCRPQKRYHVPKRGAYLFSTYSKEQRAWWCCIAAGSQLWAYKRWGIESESGRKRDWRQILVPEVSHNKNPPRQILYYIYGVRWTQNSYVGIPKNIWHLFSELGKSFFWNR